MMVHSLDCPLLFRFLLVSLLCCWLAGRFGRRSLLNGSRPLGPYPPQPKVTATRKKAGTKKSKAKSAAATKPAARKTNKKAAASVKTVAAKPTTPELVVPTQTSNSPFEDISDHLPIQACVELTRRLLTSISSLPTGAARPRAALKTIILFVAEYGSTP